jgi:hypothetical protein
VVVLSRWRSGFLPEVEFGKFILVETQGTLVDILSTKTKKFNMIMSEIAVSRLAIAF